MWTYNYSDELYHHGVLGMKWGIRRRNKMLQKAKLAKASAKEWDEIGRNKAKQGKTKWVADSKKYAAKDRQKAVKLESKAQKMQEKLNKKYKKRTQNAVKKMSTGKAVAQSMLLSSYGALVYNSARASGATKGRAIVQAITNNYANNLTFGRLSKTAKW